MYFPKIKDDAGELGKDEIPEDIKPIIEKATQ